MVEISGQPQIKKENLFSEETIKSIYDLGCILKKIHSRLLKEGYIFKDNQFILTHEKSENKNN